jgi:hypothetical protein
MEGEVKFLFWFLLLSGILSATCPDKGAVHSVAGNFANDLYGAPDTRPGTWGVQTSANHPLTFKPPAGRRVLILRITGDFLEWPLGPAQFGTQAGALVSMSRTSSTGSVWADLAADGCLLYRQAATGGQTVRAAFDQIVADGALDADNVLNTKMAAWLNNTGLTIHMEVTFVIHFRFVPEGASSDTY